MTNESADDPLLGQWFNGYRIEALLAQGGMGAVYLCRHSELPHLRKVLKVILTELLHEQTHVDVLARFEREATALSQLQHRYIAPIDGLGMIAGRRCILMPFLDGTTLEQVLQARGGRLTPHETLHVAAQIARALDYAHRRGIVHRDLKPGNILVTPTDDDPLAIKVIDFGIAKLDMPEGTTTSSPLGTPLYMAVEQYEHPSQATPLADVYALAVMVYVMTTGRHPWGEHLNTFALYHRLRHDRPAPAPVGAMPPGWEELLCAALDPDPRQRPQSMRALVYPLALMLPAGSSRTTGLDILRAVAPRWDSSPADDTIRGTLAATGAWLAASASGAWLAATTPATSPAMGAWSPATRREVESAPTSTTFWRLVLLAITTAVLAAIAVFVLATVLRASRP